MVEAGVTEGLEEEELVEEVEVDIDGMKLVIMSIGTGKMMVLFFSADMELRV